MGKGTFENLQDCIDTVGFDMRLISTPLSHLRDEIEKALYHAYIKGFEHAKNNPKESDPQG